MRDMEEILRSVEESVRIVQDPELRRIAFKELLVAALRGSESNQDPLPPNGPTSSASPLKKRATATAKTGVPVTIRKEVASLDLSPDEPLVSWDSLSTDWKKFCWILEAARLKHVDGLTNAEISQLIEKTFREHYPAEVVNNLKVQIKRGMVKSVAVQSGEREMRLWKILRAGTSEVTPKPQAGGGE